MNGLDAKPDAQVGNEEKGIWHKRLRLRKSSFSFPAEQSTVKEEENDTAHGEKETKEAEKRHANAFICSACNDGISFTPGELMTHFKIVHGGKGSAPMFPCAACGFSTPVFAALQRHRMHHNDCLFSCEICNDDVQQTLPQLTKHCQTHHSLNGQYYCPKCQLSIQEIEQFICHSCSASINHDESIDLRAAQKNNLLKHMADACRQRWSRRNWWRNQASPCKQEFKVFLPKAEPQWASQLLPPGLLDKQGMLLDPEKTLEETQQFLERTVSGANKWPISLKSEPDLDSLVATTQPKAKRGVPHPGLRRAGKDKLTGLMEKNNISVPPDCTTKVLGFKMVDGKKHLVLKVIPSNKQDTVKPTQGSNDVNTSGKCSPSQRKKEEQRDFLTSVVERIKSQQTDEAKDKALSGSEENLGACQGDSGCPSDLTSDTGSLEERCSSRSAHTLTLDSNLHADSCSVSGLDCISPSSRSPLAESLCRFQCEDEGLLFHTRADERTNNTDPRDAVVPVGQRECESQTRGAPDLCQTEDELPSTTLSHLLDEVRADQTVSSHAEPLPDLTSTGGTNQRSDPLSILRPDDLNSASAGSRESVGPLTSLNRKRMGEPPSPDSHRPVSKSQKRSARASEDASVLRWQPAARDVPTSLRLIPHSPSQSVRIPHGNQPVIVLNHPDTDIPQVTNIMKVVHKHKGAVQRVVLSRKTLSVLTRENPVADCQASRRLNGSVEERFSLKLRLKRVCGRKYTVVPTPSECVVLQPTFRCWFCGRVFRNQEAWVGHGQRHLMEATRGWDQLFNRQDQVILH